MALIQVSSFERRRMQTQMRGQGRGEGRKNVHSVLDRILPNHDSSVSIPPGVIPLCHTPTNNETEIAYFSLFLKKVSLGGGEGVSDYLAFPGPEQRSEELLRNSLIPPLASPCRRHGPRRGVGGCRGGPPRRRRRCPPNGGGGHPPTDDPDADVAPRRGMGPRRGIH